MLLWRVIYEITSEGDSLRLYKNAIILRLTYLVLLDTSHPIYYTLAIYFYECLHACMYTTYMSDTSEDRRGYQIPLEMKLWATFHLGARTEPRSFERVSSDLTHCAILPDLSYILIICFYFSIIYLFVLCALMFCLHVCLCENIRSWSYR